MLGRNNDWEHPCWNRSGLKPALTLSLRGESDAIWPPTKATFIILKANSATLCPNKKDKETKPNQEASADLKGTTKAHCR